MFRNILRQSTLSIFCLLFCLLAKTQNAVEPRTTEEWTKPFEPFCIAGNFYYVGTYDLACYLITTSQGNILINTGLASSAEQIKKNVETLGFNFSDIKILLITQAHFDHTGALAAIKEQTHAKFYADFADADVLASGGKTDYEMGKYDISFKPVKPDSLLHDGDTIKLGNMQLIMLHHPGHTKGSCSYLFAVKDSLRSYNVLIANMPTIITDRRFADIATYPNIAKDYANTLNAMKRINFDIWVASHASQFNLHDKYKPGNAYNPMLFADKDVYMQTLLDLEKHYNEKLAKDAGN